MLKENLVKILKFDLTVRRKNVKKPLEFRISREIIEVKSVESKILGNKKNIGYIKLKSFNENIQDSGSYKFLRKIIGNLY